MITIQRERVLDCLEEVTPLLAAHWTEVEKQNGVPTLNPDFNNYIELDAQGFVVTVIARNEGRIIGYMLDLVVTHDHYNELVSANDFLYVAPFYRVTTVFSDMTRFIEKELTKMNVKFRTVSYKNKERKVNRHGYTHTEDTYLKVLGE